MMKIVPYDFHTHSVFCDGNNTLEEMTLAAIAKGLSAIGFSGHSYTHFDLECGIPKEREAEYFEEGRRLKEKYKDKITVLCGIERDFYADNEYPRADYVIGSVHYLKMGEDEYFPIDLDKETQLRGVKKYFGGDYYAFCKEYFSTVAKVCEVHRCDIVGHFDLVKLYNEKGELFDESHPDYISAGKEAIKRLVKSDVLFEINSGGVCKGKRTEPYPSKVFLKEIAKLGGKVIVNGDSHSKDTLAFGFEEAVKLAKECGFKSIYTLTEQGKKELEI